VLKGQYLPQSRTRSLPYSMKIRAAHLELATSQPHSVTFVVFVIVPYFVSITELNLFVVRFLLLLQSITNTASDKN